MSWVYLGTQELHKHHGTSRTPIYMPCLAWQGMQMPPQAQTTTAKKVSQTTTSPALDPPVQDKATVGHRMTRGACSRHSSADMATAAQAAGHSSTGCSPLMLMLAPDLFAKASGLFRPPGGHRIQHGRVRVGVQPRVALGCLFWRLRRPRARAARPRALRRLVPRRLLSIALLLHIF